MTVVIHGRDGLTVEDAMRQVLDTFELVERADPHEGIVWRLVSASTNSPLTVVAEAQSRVPGLDPDPIARGKKRAFKSSIAELRSGKVPACWSAQETRRKAKALFQRTHNGISATEIRLDALDPPITVTADDARTAELALDAPPATGKPREQVGSLEGFLTKVGTHRNKPAIWVRDRRTRQEVLCMVPEQFQHEIASEANFEDVWLERRVLVRGRLHYEASGQIERVTASHVHPIAAKDVDVALLKDPDFTGGMTVEDFLEKHREGDLG